MKFRTGPISGSFDDPSQSTPLPTVAPRSAPPFWRGLLDQCKPAFDATVRARDGRPGEPRATYRRRALAIPFVSPASGRDQHGGRSEHPSELGQWPNGSKNVFSVLVENQMEVVEERVGNVLVVAFVLRLESHRIRRLPFEMVDHRRRFRMRHRSLSSASVSGSPNRRGGTRCTFRFAFALHVQQVMPICPRNPGTRRL